MARPDQARWLSTLAIATASCLFGCGGTDESSVAEPQVEDVGASASDGAATDTSDASVVDADDGSVVDSAVDTAAADSNRADLGAADTTVDAISADAAEETIAFDSIAVDDGVDATTSDAVDGNVATDSADSSATDTFVPDTFVADTFVPDTFIPDTFVPDTFVPDTFVPDTFVPDSASADTADAAAPTCTGAGFAPTGASFALPTTYTAAWYHDLSGSTSCGSSYSRPAYHVFDIDADGRQDLVVTSVCGSGNNVGTSRWIVHKGTPSGFAATGVDWALPTAYTAAWYHDLSGSTSCGSSYSRPAYHVFDVDGDGKQDLVVTSTCGNTNVGTTRWIVHKNTGTGFAATGVDWTLPTAYTAAWYHDLSGSLSCGSTYSRPAYQVLDIDGDGKQDLVVTDICSTTNIGYTRWIVHQNTGTGFAATGVDWALPTAYNNAWYYELSGSTSCGSSYSRPAYQVFDIDGDGKQDLVVTSTCGTSNVGTARWIVHKNTGTAFAATGVDWALPTEYTAAWYYELSGSTSCGSSYSRPAYQVFDIDGDHRRDLVVTDVCGTNTDVGTLRWRVHKNDGTGFAATSTSWCLPTAYKAAWYYELSGSTSCGSSYSRPSYHVFDIDGTGGIDLVVTDECGSGTTVGTSQWLVH